MNKTAKLVLENGTIFEGKSFGAFGETLGEVCFNTGMTGYQEILTDPSYCGQLITMTYPHVGNYGVNLKDIESRKIQASGFIVREENVVPSNFRATTSLGEYLRGGNIVGIQEIDTRMLTRIIRDEGAMNGIISTEDLNDASLLNKVNSAPNMDGLDLAKVVTCKEEYNWKRTRENQGIETGFKIAAIDFGIKYNILRLLEPYSSDIKVYPASVTAEEILEYNPHGIFLSNGPGDPVAVSYAIKTVQTFLGQKPIFGICLGHQILSLALGATTYKLKFGHRGCNHPVKNLQMSTVEITSQNHGFAVDPDTIPDDVEITHTSLNDNTVEGIECKNVPAFSVQYHPESSPGPHDSRYLFEKFIKLMREPQRHGKKENEIYHGGTEAQRK